LFEAGSFVEVTNWLKTNIHSHGRKFNTKELLLNITGENLDPKYYVESLKANILTSSN
jgi:carboxypeptidase Taq